MAIEVHRQSRVQRHEARVHLGTGIRILGGHHRLVDDLAAEFDLETVEQVFQRFALARDDLTVRGRRVDTAANPRTAPFTVEGRRNDLCAIGQTVAVRDVCPGIRPSMKTHHVQLGIGHHGVFSGRRWQAQIDPRVREMIQSFH